MSKGWVYTGSLTGPTDQSTAILLNNGKILKIGGNAPLTSNCQLYDPVSGTWSDTGSISVAKTMVMAVLLPSGNVLAFGGIGGNGNNDLSSIAEIYDVGSGVWSVTGSMNEARALSSYWYMPSSNKVLVAGSTDFLGGSLSSTAELYDIGSGIWSYTGSLSEAKGCAGFATWNSQIWMIGGANSSSALKTVEIFNPVFGTWSKTTDLPGVMANDGWNNCMGVSDGIITIGGHNAPVTSVGGEMSACYKIIAGGNSSATGSLHTGRKEHCIWSLSGDRLLTAGGNTTNDTVFTATSEIYDNSTGLWIYVSSLKVATIAAQINSNLLLADGTPMLMGGYTSTVPNSDVVCELYKEIPFMPITLVNSTFGYASSAPSEALTVPATTPGNLIVVAFQMVASSPVATVSDDSGSNVYTPVPGVYSTDAVYTNNAQDIWYCAGSPASATTITVSLTSGSGVIGVAVYEYAGAATSSPVDVAGNLQTLNGGHTTMDGPSLTTTNAGDVIVNSMITGNNVTGVNSPFTDFLGTSNVACGIADYIPGAIGTYQATFTGGSDMHGAAGGVAFLPQSTGPSAKKKASMFFAA